MKSLELCLPDLERLHDQVRSSFWDWRCNRYVTWLVVKPHHLYLPTRLSSCIAFYRRNAEGKLLQTYVTRTVTASFIECFECARYHKKHFTGMTLSNLCDNSGILKYVYCSHCGRKNKTQLNDLFSVMWLARSGVKFQTSSGWYRTMGLVTMLQTSFLELEHKFSVGIDMPDWPCYFFYFLLSIVNLNYSRECIVQSHGSTSIFICSY